MSEIATVYVGTYTQKMGHVDGKAGGVEICRLHRRRGTLERVATVPGVANPSFLALSHDGLFLYAVQEVEQYRGAPGGAVSAFAVEPDGGLTLINHQPTHGAAPCYLSLDRSGRWLVVANYSGGNVTLLPVLADGSLAPATQVIQHGGHPPIGDGPHPHSTVWAPDSDVLLAPDCGLNRIYSYRIDPLLGALASCDPPTVPLPPRSGPRHLAFAPSGTLAYCVNEYGSSVTSLRYDAARGALTVLQTVSALPHDFGGRNSGADIHVSADGRFVYASMRGHDSVAVLAADSDGGLELVGHAPSMGRAPRNFALDPASDLMLVANQDSSSVAIYRVDAASGMPVHTGVVADVPTPVCLLIV